MNFDYYYGDESNQFSFYRIPRQLITGEHFKRLSSDSKLLYGLLLDRMSLSARNGWYDEQGRVFIYYTLDEIQEDLNCGHGKAVKLLSELDTGKGIGLIKRVKQGQGRPAKIYVKRFTTCKNQSQSTAPRSDGSSPDCGKSAVKSSEKPKSRLPIFGSADLQKSDANYTESNQTDFSYTNPSIYPSDPPPDSGLTDRFECRRKVNKAISYERLCGQFNCEDVDRAAELIVDVLCTTRPTLRIGGKELPANQVRDRFCKLDSVNLEYVLNCLRSNAAQIHNIRAYLLTALYNVPETVPGES